MSFPKSRDQSDPKSPKHFSPMQTVLYEFMTQKDGTVPRLRSAAATLIVIASKQTKVTRGEDWFISYES